MSADEITLSVLISEFRAFRKEVSAVLAPSRRIEPNATYSANEAAGLACMHPETLREKLRIGVIAGRRKGGGGWRVSGSELLKLGGNVSAKA